MRSRRSGEFLRSAVHYTAALTAGVIAVFASASDARAQTQANINLTICNPNCTFSGPTTGAGVVTATLGLAGPEPGNFAQSDMEIIPAQFTLTGAPQVKFSSFTQAVSTTAGFVSTTATDTFFDQDQRVEHANATLTSTIPAVINYDVEFTLQLSGNASNGSFAEVETVWFFAEEGAPGGLFLDSGTTAVDVDGMGALVVSSSGHHQRDLNIVDMGGGLFQVSGSGLVTATNVPLNTTPRIGLGIFPSAHLAQGSSNAMAMAVGMDPGGLTFELRPVGPLVTITAVPEPLPEPSSSGAAALLALVALVRSRRISRR